MKLLIVEKSKVLSIFEKYSNTKEALKELFPDLFKDFDFHDIKTYEDACLFAYN